jgi:hypothetical protein
MAIELSTKSPIDSSEAAAETKPDANRVDELKQHNWVCDYETLRVMWEAQCICRLVDDAMDGGQPSIEAVQVAVQGIERLLAVAIGRTGYTGIGWQDRK